jgi:hypothetical protein
MLRNNAAETPRPRWPQVETNVPSSFQPRNPAHMRFKQGYRGIVIVVHCRVKG